MTTEEKARAYDEAIERAKKISINGYLDTLGIEYIFPELNDCDEEKIRKTLLDHFKQNRDEGDYDERWNGLSYDSIITWLEKQGDKDSQVKLPTFTFDDILALQCCMETVKKVQEDKDLYEKLNGLHGRVYDAYQLEKRSDNCLVNFDEAEKEKYDFVSGQYIECRASFNEFKEDNSYWLEYIGNDTYIGRSDNILNQKFHITPRQLYRLFTQQHCPKENNVNEETNAPTKYGKYVDECLNEASKHFFSEGEDKYSVADLFYAGVRCGKSWLEKQGEQKPTTVDIDKMVDDYANRRECGNEEFGKPLPCMIRAYKQGLNDTIRKVALITAWSEEDEKNLQKAVWYVENPALNVVKDIMLSEWLKSIKQRIKDRK